MQYETAPKSPRELEAPSFHALFLERVNVARELGEICEMTGIEFPEDVAFTREATDIPINSRVVG